MSASGSRIETLRLVAGRPCLDLVNTVSWRGDPSRREDHLRTVVDVLTWARRVNVLSAEEAALLGEAGARDEALAEGTLFEVHHLRDLVVATLVGAEPPRVEPLEAPLREAVGHSHLRPAGDGHRWQVVDLDARTVPRRLALDVLDLLEHPVGRLGSCADRSCGWVFLDTSKAGTRRWCSSADCGNRHRVRRHYRQQAGLDHPAAPTP
jgi:predicted RNA-binding Zn ribbon-like protein